MTTSKFLLLHGLVFQIDEEQGYQPTKFCSVYLKIIVSESNSSYAKHGGPGEV